MNGTLMADKAFLEKNNVQASSQTGDYHDLSFSDREAFVESLSTVSERPDLCWLIRKEPPLVAGVRLKLPSS